MDVNKFIDFANRKQDELEKAKDFLLRNDSSLFLTDMKTVFGDRFGSFMYLLRTDRISHGIDTPLFISYVEWNLNTAFSEYLNQNLLEYKDNLYIKKSSSGSTLFSFLYNDREIFHFNPFNQYFGVRNMPLTDWEVEDKIKKIKINIKEERDITTKEKKFPLELLENRFKAVNTFKEKFVCLFYPEKVKKTANKLILRSDEKLDHILKYKYSEIDSLNDESNIEYRNNSIFIIKELILIFKDLDYYHELEKHKLY